MNPRVVLMVASLVFAAVGLAAVILPFARGLEMSGWES